MYGLNPLNKKVLLNYQPFPIYFKDTKLVCFKAFFLFYFFNVIRSNIFYYLLNKFLKNYKV